MHSTRIALLLGALFSLFSLSSVHAQRPTLDNGKIYGVPAYMYPTFLGGTFWGATSSGDTGNLPPAGSIYIANQDSGVFTSCNSDWAAATASAHGAGLKVYAYVATSFGAKSESTIKSQINKYISCYGSSIDGVFLDEADLNGSVATQNILKHVLSYVGLPVGMGGLGRERALNPGQPSFAGFWAGLATHIVTIENYESTYLTITTSSLPTFQTDGSYPDSKWWHIVHTMSGSSNYATVEALSDTLHAGVVFYTDDALVVSPPANPFDALPSWW